MYVNPLNQRKLWLHLRNLNLMCYNNYIRVWQSNAYFPNGDILSHLWISLFPSHNTLLIDFELLKTVLELSWNTFFHIYSRCLWFLCQWLFKIRNIRTVNKACLYIYSKLIVKSYLLKWYHPGPRIIYTPLEIFVTLDIKAW